MDGWNGQMASWDRILHFEFETPGDPALLCQSPKSGGRERSLATDFQRHPPFAGTWALSAQYGNLNNRFVQKNTQLKIPLALILWSSSFGRDPVMAIWRRLVKATSDDRPPELEHYLPPALLLQLPGSCAFPQTDTNSMRFGFNCCPIFSFKLTHITHSITFSVYPLSIHLWWLTQGWQSQVTPLLCLLTHIGAVTHVDDNSPTIGQLAKHICCKYTSRPLIHQSPDYNIHHIWKSKQVLSSCMMTHPPFTWQVGQPAATATDKT